MPRSFLASVIAGAILLLVAAHPAAALDFPALTGRVVDQANILNAQNRNDITEKLAALEAKTTSQLVVVTLRSLQGTSIEDFGVQLGRHWGIGQKGKNNGALLIVAPTERKVRIEVGYGLEGTLTDAIAKFIIENSILPRFRAADFPGGVKRGVDDLILVLQGEGEEFKKHAVAQQPAATSDQMSDEAVLAIAGGIFLAICLVIFLVVRSVWRNVKDARSRGESGWSALVPDTSSSSSSWDSSSSSGSSFSGGGGSFGGGGSSGSW